MTGRAVSSQDFLDDVPMHVGQAEVAAGVPIRQALVIEPEELEHRGMQVMDMNFAFNRLKAEFIGLAVGVPPLDTAAGQDGRESAVVMTSAELLGNEDPVGNGSTPEFAADNYQGFGEEVSSLQVGE